MTYDWDTLQKLLAESASHHAHLCPRQVLGVRIGLAGMQALGFAEPPTKKRLLVIAESDGCFTDGLIAATRCTVGHRTLRVEDYGKIAATFVDVRTERAVRVAPRVDVRQRAMAYAPPGERRRYFIMLHAYQVMPDDELLKVEEVHLTTPVKAIISRPGVRVNCTRCGEEIINEREVMVDGKPYCRPCALGAYYTPVEAMRPITEAVSLLS